MKKCYIYTRVSTAAQIEGYSLDAQQESLREFAKYKELKIVGEYCDAGKSGKNIKGRPAFRQMMDDITAQKDDIAYVLVFKLSRFGRNAADILKSLQLLQDYGIDLVSVNDAIDSSTQGGRLTLTILSAVAEMERENITAQFMAGRMQKVMSGGWSGGAVPYGYRIENKEAVVDEKEAAIVRKIYELYMQDGMGATSVARYLNDNGYVRNCSNEKLQSAFTYGFVSNVLDNPFYCGRVYFKRRTNKKDPNGKTIKLDPNKVVCAKGIHEKIVSEENWDRVHEKRQENSHRPEKIDDPERISVLSGLVKCPVCGTGMIHIKNKRINKNHGGIYKIMHYYACGNSRSQNGRVCSFRHTYNQEKLDAAVFELLNRMQTLPPFQNAVRNTLSDQKSLDAMEEKLQKLRRALRDQEVRKEKLGIKLDGLNILGKDYDKKYSAVQDQLDEIYDIIDDLENSIHDTSRRLENMRKKVHSTENIEKLLQNLTKVYEHMSSEEKREMYRHIIDRIDVYPEDRPDGRIIKSISFNIPVYYDGEVIDMDETPDETVVFTLDCSNIAPTAAESKATYAELRAYIKEEYGLNIPSLYIAQIKRKYGLDIGKAYNKPENNKNHVPKCPREKEEAIINAMKHFKMLAADVVIKEEGEG